MRQVFGQVRDDREQGVPARPALDRWRSSVDKRYRVATEMPRSSHQTRNSRNLGRSRPMPIAGGSERAAAGPSAGCRRGSWRCAWGVAASPATGGSDSGTSRRVCRAPEGLPAFAHVYVSAPARCQFPVGRRSAPALG